MGWWVDRVTRLDRVIFKSDIVRESDTYTGNKVVSARNPCDPGKGDLVSNGSNIVTVLYTCTMLYFHTVGSKVLHQLYFVK